MLHIWWLFISAAHHLDCSAHVSSCQTLCNWKSAPKSQHSEMEVLLLFLQFLWNQGSAIDYGSTLRWPVVEILSVSQAQVIWLAPLLQSRQTEKKKKQSYSKSEVTLKWWRLFIEIFQNLHNKVIYQEWSLSTTGCCCASLQLHLPGWTSAFWSCCTFTLHTCKLLSVLFTPAWFLHATLCRWMVKSKR